MSVDIKKSFVINGKRVQTDVVMDLLEVQPEEWCSTVAKTMGINKDEIIATVYGIPCETLSWAGFHYHRSVRG